MTPTSHRWSARRQAMRDLFNGTACVYPGSVFDPMSARMASDIGFEVGMLAGSVSSMAVLGAPDHIVLTLSEFAELAYRINRASELPLMVDADHGYGNALNVMRTVEELEHAGVAGLSIEDTDLPMPFGAPRPARLISIDEGVGKMRAAVSARRDSALIIAGRTSVSAAKDFDEVIERVKAYAACGVDAIFVVGAKTRDHLKRLHAAVPVPLILGGAGPEIMDKALLGEHRVRICLQGHQPFAAGVQAVYDTLKALRDGTPPADLSGVADKSLMQQLTRDSDYAESIDTFLTTNSEKTP